MAFCWKLLLCVVVVLGLGGLGSWVTSGSLDSWYADLDRPPGVPPDVVFGPVWTVLYLMMATSFAVVWHRAPAGSDKRRAVTWFAVQLALNLLWTPVFFGLHAIGAALVVIALLVVAIVATIRSFARIDLTAAWLLGPYLLWVCYATYLNAGFLVVN